MTPVQVPLYMTSTQCSDWCQLIDDHRDWWEVRNEGLSQYGLSWYVSLHDDSTSYYMRNASAWNKRLLLLPKFKRVVEEIANYIPNKRNVPVVSRHDVEDKCWCDASIFLYMPSVGVNKDTPTRIHTDDDDLPLNPGTMFDPELEAYSCVVALECPVDGGGLYHYPYTCPNKSKLWHVPDSLFQKPVYPPKSDFQLLSYQVGMLTIIRAFDLHAVQQWSIGRRTTLTLHYMYREAPFPHYEYWW